MRHAFVGLLAVAVAWAPIHAQARPQSDSLPRELVVALLGGSLGGRNVSVQAGRAHDSIPASVFRDAEVLGFADFRMSSMTVAYFPYAPQATIDTINARLVAAGWTMPQERVDSTRGFVSGYGGGVPHGVCRGQAMVFPNVTVRTLNRTLAVVARHESQSPRGPCGNNAVEVRGRGYWPGANTPLPTLPPPAGMQNRGGGSSGSPDGDDAMAMRAELEGALPLRDVMLHYQGLFTRAGWRMVEELSSSSIAIATFEITQHGKSWHCAFVGRIPSSNKTDVHLTLRQR